MLLKSYPPVKNYLCCLLVTLLVGKPTSLEKSKPLASLPLDLLNLLVFELGLPVVFRSASTNVLLAHFVWLVLLSQYCEVRMFFMASFWRLRWRGPVIMLRSTICSPRNVAGLSNRSNNSANHSSARSSVLNRSRGSKMALTSDTVVPAPNPRKA